jgi:hypothetical protein
MSFSKLPDDKILRVIKWIDGYRMPHAGTISASVSVLFHPIDCTTMREVDRLTSTKIQQILATPHDYDPSSYFLIVDFLVGATPNMRVGDVYQGRTWVGTLPTSQMTISLEGEETNQQEFTLVQSTPPKPGWNSKAPHRVLNSSEYCLPIKDFSKSRVVVLKENNYDIVIPRQLFFQTYYGPTTQIANAFTNGPWGETAEQVICFHDFVNGLRTHQFDNEWHIILRTLVKDDYALLLAILWFDEYAKQCASSLHTEALIESKIDSDNKWYCTARFPFRKTQPYPLKVSGYWLKEWRIKEPDSESTTVLRKFLVTEILSGIKPDYIPKILSERENSGAKGSTITTVIGTAPYGGANKTPDGSAEQPPPGTNSTDPTPGAAHHNTRPRSYEWTDEPKPEKIPKDTSIRYKDFRKVPEQESNHSEQSGGNDSTSSTGADKLVSSVVVSTPNLRLQQFIAVLNELVASNHIDRFYAVTPHEPGWHQKREGYSCWNFLSKEEWSISSCPKRGWKVLDRSRRIMRSALIMELVIGDKKVWWVEIECRAKEGFSSPVIYDQDDLSNEDILDLLKVTFEKEGHHPTKNLESVVSKVAGYRHQYVREKGQHDKTSADQKSDKDGDQKKLSAESIIGFFKRIGVLESK